MDKGGNIFLLVFLIFLLIGINYRFLDTKVIEFLDEGEFTIVERVIDGDTIVVSNDTHVRLLGINTPEKGEFYYQESKDFLANLTLNKTIKLEYGKEKQDLYGRTLAYIILDGKNVNIELVDEGYANFYFPSGKDVYYNSFVKAWEHCLENGKYLCKKSNDECAQCVELKELNVKNQTVVLYNKCNFDCNLAGWNIKDEGRKKFVFQNFILRNNEKVSIIVGNETNSENFLYWKGEEYVWTSTGDTLFLRDKEGRLILWERY